ncbi:MAG: M1 family metallopeptidase [Myxococcota bacterium]
MALLSRLAWLPSIFFCACASAPPDGVVGPPAGPVGDGPVEGDAGSPPPPLWPAPFRLDAGVRPLRYDLALKVDPRAATFSGTVSIPVALDGPRTIIRMHSSALTVTTARARLGTEPIALRPEHDADENLALVAERPIRGGSAVLELTFEGPLAEAPLGLYRVQDEGRWYAFTQFEPMSARQAFPCFDEPGVKVSFGLSIDAPDPMVAVANMPEASATALEAGWTRHVFQDTPPLPTYLLAFAVGELDVIDHGKIADGRVPLRLIAAKGKGHLGAFAAARTPLYLAALERWFGSPYPFPKLDLVAVPSFGASGMENPGFITFRESLLLMDAEHAHADDRAWVEGVLAHELAHMWFGDLVTMAWWDDLWLNEAFATFAGRKVVAEVTPELGVELGVLRNRFGVMYADARPEARAIRQPIAVSGDVYNAFDGITYSKGAAVLAMLESWLGPDVFRKGVQAYLAERAGGNATTADLMRHLAEASGGLPVARVAASFADRTGVPVVDVTWSCVPMEAGAATQKVVVQLKQRAYRGTGDARPAAGPQVPTWSVPVCLGFGSEKAGQPAGRVCGVLEQAEEAWPQELPYCPAWVYPNQGEAGYYRWTVTPAVFPAAVVGPREQVGILENVRGELDAGRVPAARWLDEVMRLGDQADLPPQLLDILTGTIGWMRRMVPELEGDKGYEKVARKMLAKQPLALDLGGPDAPLATKQKQPMLLRALGMGFEDRKVLAEGKRVSEGFLGDLEHGTSTSRADLVAVYLPMYVARQGAAAAGAKARDALWVRLRAAFDKARDPSERDLIIEALASFEDPALVVKSYDLILDGTLRAQDYRTLRGSTSWRPEVARAVWEWFTGHFEGVVAKLGPKAAPALPGIAGAFCTEEDAAVVKSFFESKKDAMPSGLEHNLAGALEGIRQCALGRTQHAAAVKAWVRAQ